MKVRDLKGKWVGALVSGGLDSTTIVDWLKSKGVKVFAITVDLGQPDEKNMADIPRRMKAAGAADAIIVDGKEVLGVYMMELIQGLAHHEGGYMNTTGIARMATVKVALEGALIDREIGILTHGATGRGNDQVRFELATQMLAPSIRIYAPWRDSEFLATLGGRKQMIQYCHRRKLQITATLHQPYSTDANFCGLTHEAGKLEELTTPTNFVKFVMVKKPEKAAKKSEIVAIDFLRGAPMYINGIEVESMTQAFLTLNQIAGRHGIGIYDVVENRRVGIKSRGVYESPGATLLEFAYAKMLQLILDRSHRKLFDSVSRQLADAIYEGEWFSPHVRSLLAVTQSIAQFVTGGVSFSLYRGNISFVEARNVEHSLYDPQRSSMEMVGEFNHADSQGYLNIAGVLARALAAAGQVRSDATD